MIVSTPSWSSTSQTNVRVGKVKLVSPPISATNGLLRNRKLILGFELRMGRTIFAGVASTKLSLSRALISNQNTSKSDRIGT